MDRLHNRQRIDIDRISIIRESWPYLYIALYYTVWSTRSETLAYFRKCGDVFENSYFFLSHYTTTFPEENIFFPLFFIVMIFLHFRMKSYIIDLLIILIHKNSKFQTRSLLVTSVLKFWRGPFCEVFPRDVRNVGTYLYWNRKIIKSILK